MYAVDYQRRGTHNRVEDDWEGGRLSNVKEYQVNSWLNYCIRSII
jgi:hypothetical protein